MGLIAVAGFDNVARSLENKDQFCLIFLKAIKWKT
jgi:hypothetical protein